MCNPIIIAFMTTFLYGLKIEKKKKDLKGNGAE